MPHHIYTEFLIHIQFFLNNQVKSLLSGSDEKLKDIYIQSLPILEHNFNTLLKMDWKNMVYKLVDMMGSKLI